MEEVDEGGEEEVQPPHAPPHLYWDNNSGGTLKTEVKTPEDIKVNPENFGNSDDGYTKIYKLGEVNFFDIDLTDLIKKICINIIVYIGKVLIGIVGCADIQVIKHMVQTKRIRSYECSTMRNIIFGIMMTQLRTIVILKNLSILI